MNMETIESQLAAKLKRALRREAQVFKVPPAPGNITIIKPEVFVHSSTFVDFGGKTKEGNHIARRPATMPPTFKGFAEERPGRIIVEIYCLASTYAKVQDLSAIITPAALFTFESISQIPLASVKDKSIQLSFADFSAYLHASTFTREQQEDNTYYCGI